MIPAEYERRRQFCEIIKTIGIPEQIEIARILREKGVAYSENRDGIMFDLTMISSEIFDELLKAHEFIRQSDIELNRR
jgi:hypothetical protein